MTATSQLAAWTKAASKKAVLSVNCLMWVHTPHTHTHTHIYIASRAYLCKIKKSMGVVKLYCHGTFDKKGNAKDIEYKLGQPKDVTS